MKFEYQGRQMQLEAAVRRYVRQVERKLRLPKTQRERVLSDLLTTICARLEQDETTDEILASIGSAEQVAEEFNTQLQIYTYRKSPWRFAFLVLGVLALLWLTGWGLGQAIVQSIIHGGSADVGIIGGADGPTQIFITSSTGLLWDVLIAVLLAVIGIIGFFALGHLKNRKIK